MCPVRSSLPGPAEGREWEVVAFAMHAQDTLR
jgi:hypothetical protein